MAVFVSSPEDVVRVRAFVASCCMICLERVGHLIQCAGQLAQLVVSPQVDPTSQVTARDSLSELHDPA